MSGRRRSPRARVVGAVLLVVLVVAMALSTRFVTPEELAAAEPERFDPEATAAELYAAAGSDVLADAPALGDVTTAAQADLPAAAEEFGATQPDETTYLFPVSGEGTVVEGGEVAVSLRVPGVPEQTPVSVTLGTAISGTVLRDALGFGFADAPTQSAFQQVGDGLKALMQADVAEGLGDQPLVQGDQVSFTGVVSVTDTGGPLAPERPVAVQPVSLERVGP